MSDRLECEKKELLLGIDAFNQPAETSGAIAWGNLVGNLAFMVPGTIPSDPEMGVNIQQYSFAFTDDICSDVENNLRNQITTYLPDIPLESITVSNETTEGGQSILYINLVFNMENNKDNIAVIAAEKTNSIINFVVV